MKNRLFVIAAAAVGLFGLMGAPAPSSAAVAQIAASTTSAIIETKVQTVLPVQFRGGFRGMGRGFRGGGGRFRGGFARGGWGRYGRVQGRYWGGRRWGGRYWRRGRWIAPLIGGAIIGGYGYRRYYDYPRYRRVGRSAWQLCADRYRSFSWSDGTYLPYIDGPRRLCPYLR